LSVDALATADRDGGGRDANDAGPPLHARPVRAGPLLAIAAVDGIGARVVGVEAYRRRHLDTHRHFSRFLLESGAIFSVLFLCQSNCFAHPETPIQLDLKGADGLPRLEHQLCADSSSSFSLDAVLT